MSLYLRVFKHLLTKSRALSVIYDKFLRKFFDGLSEFQGDYRLFADQVFEDVDPALTRELETWETQFALSGTGTESERRQALDAAWKARGGQSPGYLQGILRDAGFDVYVHEWWYFDGPTRKTRDPRMFVGVQFTVVLGEPDAVLGEPGAVVGERLVGERYLLVNKGPGISYFKPSEYNCLGEPQSVLGEPQAVLGETKGLRFVPVEYTVPDDPAKWPFFVYVGAETFPDLADVSAARRIEFERMVLKYFPDQLWVVMLINYT